MKLRLFMALVGIIVFSAPSLPHAQADQRASARDVVKRWQAAIVNVRVVLKTRMSMAGRELQSSDETIEAVGTVIEPSGLLVMSLGVLNPGAMMTKMMGAMGGGGGGDQKMDITSEPTDLKMRLPDGREIPAKIVLRDEDLDLAFIRPATKLDKLLVAVNLADGATPALLEQVVVLSRLGRVGGWAAGAALYDIGAIIERPRTFFVLASQGATIGVPAFLPSGRIIGLLTLRQVDAGRPGMMSMMGGSESLGLLPVILPAADVLEISKQAVEK
jgi:S1-C subfamily serine protease